MALIELQQYFADTVIEYFDSGAGPIPGPYGFTDPNGNGVIEEGEPGVGALSPDVVLGSELAPGLDALSLPTGSFVTVGFTNAQITDGPSFDILIGESGAAGDRADVFVSADGVNFSFLGTAQDDVITAFDLASIGFTQPVTAVKIVGLDNQGASPGFDVANVRALQVFINGQLILRGTNSGDSITGRDDDDQIDGDEGDDTLTGRRGNDSLTGNTGNDSINGGDSRDVLFGEDGDDRLIGGDGGDSLEGGTQADVLLGGKGRDTLKGDEGRDDLYGGDDNDRLRGGQGQDTVRGGNGDDRVSGGRGEDTLLGGDGNDRLIGGDGNDLIDGGKGNDTLRGGSGRDIFVIRPDDGADVIQGFQDGSDRFQLVGGLTFGQLTIGSNDNNTTISFGNQLLATVVGVNSNLITAADFVQPGNLRAP